MFECSKAIKRRYNIGAFHERYFVGNGIDVGAGNDCLSRYLYMFPRMTSVMNWDLPQGDAQLLATVNDNEFNFLHSSHCLEHMANPTIALDNWIRVIKPGGHLIITVPDYEMYEHSMWPSRFNGDHKWGFTLNPGSIGHHVYSVIELIAQYDVIVEKIELIRDFYNPDLQVDQTMLPNAECCIEIILQKR